MRTVFLASLRLHLRRYVAAAIAVIAAATLVVAIGVLTSGARNGFMDGFGAPYRNADHVVSRLSTDNAITLAERLGDNASVVGRAKLPMHAGGRLFPETAVGPITTSERLRWQTLSSGRFPERTGEAVVDVWVAQASEIAIGDRIRVGGGAAATDLTVAGLVESPSTTAQASVYVTLPQLLRWRADPSLSLGRVAVVGEVGPLPQGARVQSPQEHVDEARTQLNQGVDALSVMLLVFAAVALFVSVLVVANTFSILFAQRLRDFALLRCVGATRRQVVRSVRREAAVVGVLASLAGVVAGTGLGYALIALINVLAPATPMRAGGPPVLWLLGGFAAALAITLIASWLPTRRVVRVNPLAALRPDHAVDVHTTTGLVRVALAAILLIAGLGLLAAAMIQDSTALMVAGGISVFTGVLAFGPVVVPRLVQVFGVLLGPAGRLATRNAVRNPRRTATTTASLLVGVTVTSAVLTGLATASAAMEQERGRKHPIDASLTSSETALPADLLERVRRTQGVEQAIAVQGIAARVDGLVEPVPVLTAPGADQVARDGGAFASLEPGEIRFDFAAFGKALTLRPGDRVAVRAGDREAELRVAAGTGWGRVGVVAPETLAMLTDSPRPLAIWIRAGSGADPVRLVGALDELADPAGATTEDQLQARQTEEQDLRILTWSVLGLLAVSVVIALIGIANTLGLSVLERVREHALLRALGLTRVRMRWMLAAEAVLLSLVATVLGTVIGVGFAWAGHETFVKQALRDATMQIPWLSLGVVVLIAALAGLIASVLPARRAARVTPAAGLSLD